MSGLVRKGFSYWDIIPVETAIDICKFLPTLDLLNICVAYPEIQQSLVNTGSLWRRVHLPFPDPLLHSYPGWRKIDPLINMSSTSKNSSSTMGTNPEGSNTINSNSAEEQERIGNAARNGLAILWDERYHILSEPDYFDLPDIKGGEHDSQDENTSWIILDVLNEIPLQYVRQLSFDSPPCYLCVYPCKRLCECECHQNDQSHLSHHRRYQSFHENELQAPEDHANNDQLSLSQPLQDLFESGLVDFGRHIDLRSLNEILATDNTSNSSNNYGNSNFTYVYPTENRNTLNEDQFDQIHDIRNYEAVEETIVPTDMLNQLGLQDALSRLVQIEDLNEDLHTPIAPTQETEFLNSFGREIGGQDEEHSEEETLEQLRQFFETRAAHQRARLLIRILTLNDLKILETLRAPWWPAARIYTIRQQLERWSFMIEQTQAATATASVQTHEMMEDIADEIGLLKMFSEEHSPADTSIQSSFLPWHTRWTNVIGTQRHGGVNSKEPSIPENLASQQETSTTTSQQPLTTIVFPLPNLSRFILRSGGEVISHERHSIGESAMN
ncbi:hypothetical protein BGZ49_010156 [Haplosporangium sp. Z 27]|nr:hypothetical protein BGZ49_010156 [Haplosporangium sp. Z 27]